MPQRTWSDQRERQYEHIKSGLKKKAKSEDVAEEIAARTVGYDRRDARRHHDRRDHRRDRQISG